MFRLITPSIFIFILSLSISTIFTVEALAAENYSPKESESISQIAILTVNINQASAEEIADVMTGIGIKKAQVIVNYRNKNGVFKSVEQLLEVKGIGPATIEKNRHKLKL
jgi:competence protein ComEA